MKQIIFYSGCALFLTGCQIEDKPIQPNIVLIFTDDQGYGDLSCYGSEKIHTPHIDSLALLGMKFTDFHVASSVSSPSRAALMTGCYPLRVGIPYVLYHKKSWGREANIGLNPEEETIAELLKKKGYATAMAGKWHLGHLKEFLPLRQGFDSYLGLPYSNDMNLDSLPLIKNDEIVEVCPQQSSLTKKYTKFCVEFIKEKANKTPFFLYMAHTMPHVPIAASNDFKGVSQGGAYGDVVEEIDWSVGEIINELKAQNIYDNTLVIFMTDNGPWLSYGNHGGSNGGLREGKFSVFEGGFRVPCIMSYPKIIPKNIVSEQLLTSLDILPTLCELTGAPLPVKKIDGISVMPVLRGEIMPELDERPFFYHSDNNVLAVRQGKWKYIDEHEAWWILDTPGQDGVNGKYRKENISASLFDMDNDFAESNNLLSQYPEQAKRMKTLLNEFKKQIIVEKRPAGCCDIEK